MGGQQSIKLCQKTEPIMTEDLICDITVGPGPDDPRRASSINSGFNDFQFRAIGLEESASRGDFRKKRTDESVKEYSTALKEWASRIKGAFESVGLHAGQMGASKVKKGNYAYGKRGAGQRDESCSRQSDGDDAGYGKLGSTEFHLYVTSKGCATPALPGGKPMKCVLWKATEWEHTPYGPMKGEKDCDYLVGRTDSGYCVCETAEGATVLHAAKAYNGRLGNTKSFKPFTCQQECEMPTWIAPVSGIKMAYSEDPISKVDDGDGYWHYKQKVQNRAKCGEDAEKGGTDSKHDPPIKGSNTVGYDEEIKYWQNPDRTICKSPNTKWIGELDTSLICLKRNYYD